VPRSHVGLIVGAHAAAAGGVGTVLSKYSAYNDSSFSSGTLVLRGYWRRLLYKGFAAELKYRLGVGKQGAVSLSTEVVY
jgi:hypothetical protein